MNSSGEETFWPWQDLVLTLGSGCCVSKCWRPGVGYRWRLGSWSVLAVGHSTEQEMLHFCLSQLALMGVSEPLTPDPLI